MVMMHFMQVKVVHHLPGRLRLYVPILESLSSDWRQYQSDLIDIIKIKKGLIDIDVTIRSGRVLICYDPHQIDRTLILRWLKKVALKLYTGYLDAPFQSKQQIVPFLQKMRCQSVDWLQRNSQVKEVA